VIEISLHGRGGQGVVAAGELLVKGAVKQGIYAQSIPFFGGERRGAPVRSGVRISDSPIYTHDSIKNADIMAIFDLSLLDVVDLHILKENLEICKPILMRCGTIWQGLTVQNLLLNKACIALFLYFLSELFTTTFNNLSSA